MDESVLCLLSDLPDPGARGPFQIGAVSVFVVRHGQSVRAFVNSCPHIGAPLEFGPDRYLDLTGEYVLCSLHGAHFEPETGLCVLGPCKGRSLSAYPVRVDNGKVILGPLPDGL